MINVINSSTKKVSPAFIQKWVKAVYKELDRMNGSALHLAKIDLTVVFLNTAPAKKLNMQFRKKNYATDILSFAGDLEDSLGELVLCSQVLQKQAKEHKLTFNEELGYMLTHGVLHLMGFDHEKSKKEAKIMHDIQDLIFDKLCKKLC